MKGERLAELRRDKGLTQKEFAECFSLSTDTISKYERNVVEPVDATKVAFAKFFNVSLDYLMGLIDEEVPYSREHYIVLPKSYPPKMKQDLLEYYELLKLKYQIK